MSLHRSLAAGGRTKRHRNVLTREERIAKLEDEGRWDEGMSVFGLAKVRSIKPVTGKKGSKKAQKVAEAAQTEGGTEEAAPAEAGDTK
jgi:small basic protein (TIGR04137 family)